MRIVIYDDHENVICAHYVELNTLHDEHFITEIIDEVEEHYVGLDDDNLTGFHDGIDRW